MGSTYAEISPELQAFIESQPLFFVATAGRSQHTHLNLSPKGLGELRVIGPRLVAYLDLVGSGVETIAHLRDDGRVVIMLCAFDGPPKIVRLHGTGEVIEPADDAFEALTSCFPEQRAGVRSVIKVHVQRISDSCGYGVPRLVLDAERPQLPAWVDRKGADGLGEYQQQWNAESIDGLPGLRWVNPSGREPTRR